MNYKLKINIKMKTNKMTPVDEFAKAAMQSYMQICEPFQVNGGYIANTAYSELAKYSYEIADEMNRQKTLRDRNLCLSCKKCFATCNASPDFGLAIGFDNVVKCTDWHPKQKRIIRTFFKRIFFSCKNFVLRLF